MNTTFTNCAEKKAKQLLNLLQGYTKGIRMTAILILLLMGVSNAWAGNNIAFQNGANFYFDPYYNATQSVDKGYIQLAVRKYQNTGGDDYGWYTGVTTLSKIANTRLYYTSTFEGPSWTDNGLSFHGWAMISNSSKKSNGEIEYWKDDNSTWYSDFKNYGLNNGSTYLFVATSATKGQSIEPSGTGYLADGFSALNSTQTIKTAVNGTDANSMATISITSYKMTGDGSATEQTASIATGAQSTTISAARTATTTLPVGTVATGYQFDGWYAAQTGRTLSTSTTYTYYPTAATTVYARFSAKKYTITYKDQGGSNFSGTHTSEYPTKHTYGTATTLKTATKTGYTFGGWHTDQACTNKVTSLGETVYTANITLYAKWTATPTTIYLKPSDTWKSNNARLAIYWWGDENRNGWVDLEADCSNTTTYYSGDMPAGITNFKFVRLNPSGGHAFGDAWNQTDNLTIQSGKYLYDMTQSKKDHIFLKPNNDWKNDNAWFAAYFYNSGNSNNTWKRMTHHSDGVYGCEWPSGYTNVIFVRMKNTDTNSLTFDNAWNQTKDLGYNANDNMFIVASSAINGGDDGGKYDGSWSIYYDHCFWSNATPTYTVTFSQPTGGTIAVTKEDGSSITSGTKVELNSEINVTISAKDGYEYSTTSKITIGKNTKTLIEGASTHTICGMTNISAKFSEKLYTVTIRTSDANQGTVSPETLQVGKITPKSIKATSKTGSIFSHWEASDGITITNANSAQTTVKATCAGTITAYFSPGRTIYLKPDHSNWKNSSYQAHVWTEGLARIAIDMVQDGNFYKCEVPGAYTKIQFQKKNSDVKTEEMDIMATCNFFDVDDSDQAKGVWMEYNAWHIAGTFTDWKLCGYQMEEKNGVYTYIRHFEAGDYDFKIVQNGTWYGNNGDMTREYCVNWIMDSSESSDCTLKADVGGDYVFTFNPNTKQLTVTYPELPYYLFGTFNNWTKKDAKYQFINGRREVWLDQGTTYSIKVIDFQEQAYGNASSPTLSSNSSSVILQEYNMDGDVKFTPPVTGSYTFTFDVKTKTLSVILPETPKDGDYRLAYIEGTNTSSFHPGHHIKKSAIEKIDTVSFFIAHDKTPKILVQQYNGTTWSTQATKAISVDASGVYNFHLRQTNGGNTATLLETIEPYTGKYYIRTNCADGGWNDFKIAANLMTYSSYADTYEIFDHYFCKWVGNDYTRLAFTIANDYSYCVSDTLHGDSYTNDDSSSQKAANVRFAWDSKENKLSRAYIDGTGENGSEFLQLRDASNLKDANGNVLTSITFNDLQNWIYQVDVKANKDTEIKLVAKYNNVQQYFKGTENSKEKLLQSTSNDFYNIRVIYDFKTNHLIAAWLAAGETIDNTETLGADMMVIRRDQNPADQLHFNPNTTTLADVKTAYAVTTFSKDFITDETKTQYERALYWVSFPFDVRISDVFGFGEYGDQWIMQYYDGAARARYGLFSNSGTYWKYITETDTILQAGKGYVLTLDLDKVKNSFLHDAQDVSLYFPSKDPLGEIDGTLPTNILIPEHTCNIQYGELDHTITDSHWNMIGVPRFADISDFNTTPGYVNTEDLSFYYEYLARTNTYQVTANTTNFQAMYGYMVQFAGTLNWSEKTVSPAQLAARRNGESELPEKISFRLEIAQDEVMADQTFVQLQQEGATADFDMNLDLTKIINSGANIYTLAGEQRIQSAGNALPMGEAVVPVGVKIDAEGEYTLRMPDGTEGMVVELLDYETNTRTNLLLDDYTITLSAGSYENRFALHIQPQKDVTTGVGNVGDRVKGIEKYLIDGKLIIRTAEGIFDAQGHRL